MDVDWTDQRITWLKALWAEGLSTAQIGSRMGISKNAVVGKAHRLLLLARPSPIVRDRAPKPAKAARVRGATLPSLAQPAVAVAIVAPPAQPAVAVAIVAPLAPVVRTYEYAPITPRDLSKRHHGCAFPLWDDRSSGYPDFPMCDVPIPYVDTYCAVHQDRCYMNRPRSRVTAPSERAPITQADYADGFAHLAGEP